jgi:hypothetical protein
LVNLKDNTDETYTNPSNGAYYQMQIFERGEVIQSRTLSFLTIETNNIFGHDLAGNEMEN